MNDPLKKAQQNYSHGAKTPTQLPGKWHMNSKTQKNKTKDRRFPTVISKLQMHVMVHDRLCRLSSASFMAFRFLLSISSLAQH